MPQRASWTYHLTFALPVAPLILAVLALTLIAGGKRRATVMAMCVAYYLVLMATEALVHRGLPPAAGAWMPNVMAASGCGVFHVIAAGEDPRLATSCAMIPGRLLHRLAARLCSAQTLERVVEPAIADLQKEYAGRGTRVGGARWVSAEWLRRDCESDCGLRDERADHDA